MNFANAFQGFVVLAWVAVAGLIALAVIRASRGQQVRAISTAILVVSIAALILTSVSAGLVFVEPEERAVVISAVADNGVRTDALQPGLRWIIPFLERVERYPISRQTYTMSGIAGEGQVQGDDSVTARTSDGQEIFLDASVIYAVDPNEVVPLHVNWQRRYTDELIRPLSRGVIRGAVSQFGVEQVYSTNRAELTLMIEEELTRRLAENGVTMMDFVLRNITFSPEYAASVEQKQISEQLAQQARFVVEQRRQEAEQARQVAQGLADSDVIQASGRAEARVIEAEAEKQALELIAQALSTSPDLLNYQYITKLAPNIQAFLVPSNAPFLLPFPEIGPLAPEGGQTPTPTATPFVAPTPTPTEAP